MLHAAYDYVTPPIPKMHWWLSGTRMNRIIIGAIAHAEQENMNFCQPPQLTVSPESVKQVASATAQPPN